VLGGGVMASLRIGVAASSGATTKSSPHAAHLAVLPVHDRDTAYRFRQPCCGHSICTGSSVLFIRDRARRRSQLGPQFRTRAFTVTKQPMLQVFLRHSNSTMLVARRFWRETHKVFFFCGSQRCRIGRMAAPDSMQIWDFFQNLGRRVRFWLNRA